MRLLLLVAGALSLALGVSSGTSHALRDRALRVPVLVLHHVKRDRPEDDAVERGLTIHPTQLRSELDFLAAHSYHTVSASRVANVLVHGGGVPARPVLLTFDDGYADAYRTVYPLLRRRHMIATFFVCPGLLGRPHYMTWHQVQVMARGGMDMEAHTLTHPDLRLVPAREAWEEVSRSRRILSKRLHTAVHVFAYPYGSFSSAVLHDVRNAGYWAAFTTQQGWSLRARSRFLLPRVYVDRDDSLRQFAARLTGNLTVVERDPT